MAVGMKMCAGDWSESAGFGDHRHVMLRRASLFPRPFMSLPGVHHKSLLHILYQPFHGTQTSTIFFPCSTSESTI